MSNRANVLKTELCPFHHRLRWVTSKKEVTRTTQVEEEQNLCLSTVVLGLICMQLAASQFAMLLGVDLLGTLESLKQRRDAIEVIPQLVVSVEKVRVPSESLVARLSFDALTTVCSAFCHDPCALLPSRRGLHVEALRSAP